jgi:hypothetical protein
VPTLTYFFGSRRKPAGPLDVIFSFDIENVANIYVARMGAFAIVFNQHRPLASNQGGKRRELSQPAPAVPYYEQRLTIVRERRLLFSTFLAAAIFGRHAALTNSSLIGARHSGLEAVVPVDLIGKMRPGKIYGDGLSAKDFGDDVSITLSTSADFDWLIELIKAKFSSSRAAQTEGSLYISVRRLRQYVQYVRHLLERDRQFGYADLQSIVGMNYQAAILHRQYHNAASLALNLMVLEVLTKEIFYSYGLVGNNVPRPFATKPHEVLHLSNKAFQAMRFIDLLKRLKTGGLLDPDLAERIDAARRKRNGLMHRGEPVTSAEAWACQAAVRDLWHLLIPTPFELMG